MWSPAPGSKLTLWFSVEGVTIFSEDGSGLYRRLTESLGFRNPKGEASVKIAVSSRRLTRVVELLPEALKEHRATLRWSLTEPTPIPVDDQSWFGVAMGGAEADNALKLREGVHFGYIQLGEECGRANVFVASDRFLAVVREHQLAGLESLPLPAAGKRPQTGWSQVFATRPMGRGLDHPAVDSDLVEPAYEVEKGWPRRFGVSRAWNEIVDARRIGHAAVAQLFRLGHGAIAGPDRFVREHTPEADFAYTGWGTSDGQRAHRERRILFSRRARDVMVEAGLIKASKFDPVLVIPAAEANNPILDRTIFAPLPPPSYTPEELAAERARRETMLRGVPVRAVRSPLTSIGAARRAFAQVAKSQGVRVLSEEPSRLEEMRRSPLFDQLPRPWRELVPDLPITLPDPDDRRVDLWVAAAPRRVERPADGDLKDAPDGEIPSELDIVIGTNDFGDWYAVRADDPGLPHDASIKLWSHETLSVSGEWSSVLNFATYLVHSALDAIDEKPWPAR